MHSAVLNAEQSDDLIRVADNASALACGTQPCCCSSAHNSPVHKLVHKLKLPACEKVSCITAAVVRPYQYQAQRSWHQDSATVGPTNSMHLP